MMEIIECWLLLLGLFSVQEQADCTKENLAQRGTATQSTTSDAKSADRAIDGGKDFSTSSSTCAATNKEQNPWWRLDLQSALLPNIVVVTYRDDSFPDIMRPIHVLFGNSLQIYGDPICTVISSDQAAFTITYSCGTLEGRYVTIRAWWASLSVCEVEVYETDSEQQTTQSPAKNEEAMMTTGTDSEQQTTQSPAENEEAMMTTGTVISLDYIKRSFMKLAFNSSADLTDPTVMDQVLKELTSALAVRGITNVTLSWSQTPEEEVIENDSH